MDETKKDMPRDVDVVDAVFDDVDATYGYGNDTAETVYSFGDGELTFQYYRCIERMVKRYLNENIC